MPETLVSIPSVAKNRTKIVFEFSKTPHVVYIPELWHQPFSHDVMSYCKFDELTLVSESPSRAASSWDCHEHPSGESAVYKI